MLWRKFFLPRSQVNTFSFPSATFSVTHESLLPPHSSGSVDTCCTNVGGYFLQTQFWDTNPSTGPVSPDSGSLSCSNFASFLGDRVTLGPCTGKLSISLSEACQIFACSSLKRNATITDDPYLPPLRPVYGQTIVTAVSNQTAIPPDTIQTFGRFFSREEGKRLYLT